MVKRIGFIVLVCCALGWAYAKGARPAVELDHTIRLWGYELRVGLLVEVGPALEHPADAAVAAPETSMPSLEAVGLDVVPADGELP